MVYCQSCGKKNSDSATFCINCGVKISSEKIEPKRNDSETTNISSSTFSDLMNKTKNNLENDALLIKQFAMDIQSIIKKYGSNEVKNEKEFETQIKDIDSHIDLLKKNLDGKLEIYKSDMIQIDKIRDNNKPFNIKYSISLKKGNTSSKNRKVLFTDSENNKTELKVIIGKRHISIPEIDFRAISPIQSENEKFLLAYRDSYHVLKDGKRETVEGQVVFIKDNELFLKNELERPHDGKVSENGNFIINDWMLSGELCGTFYAFNSEATVIMRTKFNSNLGNNELSENGQYAVLETAHSPSDDADKIFFFDLNNKKILWERKRDAGNVKRFKFDLKNKLLTVFYDNDRNYRHSFQGEFLDQDKIENDRISYADGYGLFNIAKERMEKLDYENNSLSDYGEVLSFLEKSLKQNISDYTKARVYRKIGEIYYNFDKTDETLENFEKAMSHDPKVGIKRLYDKLNKKR